MTSRGKQILQWSALVMTLGAYTVAAVWFPFRGQALGLAVTLLGAAAIGVVFRVFGIPELRGGGRDDR